jgi:hypothetical protein
MGAPVAQSNCASIFQSLLGLNVPNGTVTVQNETKQTTIGNSWDSLLQLHAELSAPEVSAGSGPPPLPVSRDALIAETDGRNTQPALTPSASNRLNASLTQVCAVSSTPVNNGPTEGVSLTPVPKTNVSLPSTEIALPTLATPSGSQPGDAWTTAGPIGTPGPVLPQLPVATQQPTPGIPTADLQPGSLLSASAVSAAGESTVGASGRVPIPSPVSVSPAKKGWPDLRPASDPSTASAPNALGGIVQPSLELQPRVAVPVQPASDQFSSSEGPEVETPVLSSAGVVKPPPAARVRPSLSAVCAVAAPTVFAGASVPALIPATSPSVDSSMFPSLDHNSHTEAAITPTYTPASRPLMGPTAVTAASADGARILSDLPGVPVTTSSGSMSGTGGAVAQSVVDHFAFELTMRRQTPSPEPDAASSDLGSTSAFVAAASRSFSSCSSKVAATPDLMMPSGPIGDTDHVSVKRNESDLNPEPPVVSSTSIRSDATAMAAVLPSSIPTASNGISKPDLPTTSLSEKLPIDTPERASQITTGVVHEVNLRVQGDSGESVSVRLSDHSGQVQISVRSTDQGAATTLRQDLSSLSAGLERQGWKTDVSGMLPQAAVRDLSNTRHSDDQGRQQSHPDWQAPPDKKRSSPSDQWAEMNEQETT